MTIEEQFEKWMDEKIPAIYQGKKVILHRYDTMSEADEQIAKAAWLGSRQAVEIELPFLFPFYRQEVTEVLNAAGLKVKPC